MSAMARAAVTYRLWNMDFRELINLNKVRVYSSAHGGVHLTFRTGIRVWYRYPTHAAMAVCARRPIPAPDEPSMAGMPGSLNYYVIQEGTGYASR